MDKIIYECENISPIIMKGAYDYLELRAQSIKGWMRYWWRAITAYEEIKELKNKEKEIFGSLDKKADFSIRVSYEERDLILDEKNIVPHRELKEYHGRKKPIKIKVIDKGKFNLKLNFYNNKYEELICLLFELSCVLGGIGRRARRGFGSIEIIKKNSIKYQSANSLEEVLDKLNLITKISRGKYLYKKNGAEIVIKKVINAKYPFIEKIILKDAMSTDSVDTLITKMSLASHNHCNGKLVDKYDKALLDFFLHKYDRKINRYASPIYMSIARINSEIQPITTILHSNEIKRDRLLKERQAFINEVYGL